MRRWFCALLTVLFAVYIGLPANGMTVSRTVAAATAGEAGPAAIVAPRCCGEKEAIGSSQTSHCTADCVFSIVTIEFTLPLIAQGHDADTRRPERPRYSGAVFRPPIA